MACTIHDVAAAAGVSITTVSLVLRGKDRKISKSTADRIIQVAKDLNYAPNQVAVSLVTRQTHTIGLIYADMLNPFYAELAAGVEHSAHEHGYSLLICNCDEQVERCVQNIQLLINRQVDGFVLQPPEMINANEETLEQLKNVLNRTNTPYVILDRAIHNLFHDYIAADHQLGGHMAVEHLVKYGHKRIGCITGTLSDYGTMKRLVGYKEVLRQNNIPYDASLVYEGVYQMEAGYRGAKKLFEKNVTAIFAFSDTIAAGVQKAALEMGLNLPDDLSLVGYDDSSIATLCTVPLTTIRQPIEIMGNRACELLLERIQYPDRSQRDYLFPPMLVERNSCSIPPT